MDNQTKDRLEWLWVDEKHEPSAMVVAIQEHAKAMLELAQAIREHAYLTAPDDEDEDAPPQTYMDGTPVQ